MEDSTLKVCIALKTNTASVQSMGLAEDSFFVVLATNFEICFTVNTDFQLKNKFLFLTAIQNHNFSLTVCVKILLKFLEK